MLEFPIRLIPKTWNFDNYATVFTKSSFLLYYWELDQGCVLDDCGQPVFERHRLLLHLQNCGLRAGRRCSFCIWPP